MLIFIFLQISSDAVPLIFGLHCTCVFSYLSKPLKCITFESYHPLRKVSNYISEDHPTRHATWHVARMGAGDRHQSGTSPKSYKCWVDRASQQSRNTMD